jgi:hypothetical protein
MLSIQSLQQMDWSSENINNIKKYIISNGNNIPDLNPRQKKVFIERFKNNFIIEDEYLSYKPLKLIVIPSDANNKEERYKILDTMFRKPEAIGKGQNNFHKFILRNYLGINREEIIEFLKSKPEYQLFQKKTTVVSKSLRPQYPLHYIAIDLVDMGKESRRTNNQYRYIFSAMDLFTNYSWFYAMKLKNAQETLNCLKKLLRNNLSLSHPQDEQRQEELERAKQFQYPKYILSDQGSEFKGIFSKFLQTHNIGHKQNPSYTPQPNIEAVNGVLRNILRALFIRNKNKVWFNQLEDVMKSKNSNHDNNTGKPANELFVNYVKEIQLSDEVKDKFKNKTQKLKKRYKKQRSKSRKYNKLVKDLKVGKKVRVRFSNFQSAVRDKIKAGNMKNIIMKFSPKVYIIDQIIKKPNNLPLYILKTEDGKIIRNEKKSNESEGKKRMFKISDLQLVSDNTISEKYISFSDANRLNNVQNDYDTGRDLYIEPEIDEEIYENVFEPKTKKVKKAVSYTLEEWIDILEGESFKSDIKDDGDVKSYIISQVYMDSIYKRSYIMVDFFEERLLDESEETINSEMERMQLRDVLKDAKKFNAEWYKESYDIMISKRKKTKKVTRLPLRKSRRLIKELPSPSISRIKNINISPIENNKTINMSPIKRL